MRPLLMAVVEPEARASGLMEARPVESSVMAGAEREARLPIVRDPVPAEAEERVREAVEVPPRRTAAPLPEMTEGEAAGLPEAARDEPETMLMESVATRVRSPALRVVPALSMVMELASGVMVDEAEDEDERVPPMRRLAACQLERVDEESVMRESLGDEPSRLMRKPAAEAMSMELPRPLAAPAEKTEPDRAIELVAEMARRAASDGRDGWGRLRRVAASRRKLLAKNDWYSARARMTGPGATSKTEAGWAGRLLEWRLLKARPETRLLPSGSS